MTALDQVQHPNHPTIQHQLSPGCTITKNGVTYHLGGVSCTAYAMAMLVDRATGGRSQPSGCSIRRETGDVSGGLTLTQVAKVARDSYGIAVSVYTGSNVVSPSFLARQIRAGRPAVVQGGTGAYLGTTFKVTDGDVNHAEEWDEVRGGTLDVPGDVLVYDPCADHRRPDIDSGPTWIPWKTALKFASYLEPGGEGTGHLGPGKIYCAVGPDTEPHVSLISGAKQARPFPDRVRAAKATTVIHRHPAAGSIVRSVPKGRLLRLYQYVDGWGGNDDGTEWVFLGNVTHVGGST